MASNLEQKMFQMEQKSTRKKFVPNQAKNVREQSLFQVEQKMLKKKQKCSQLKLLQIEEKLKSDKIRATF